VCSALTIHVLGSDHMFAFSLTAMMLCAPCRPEDGAVAAAGGAGAAATATTSSSSSKPKKTPEDISYDALVLLLTSFKTCYMAVAKSIHTASRRREEAANVPTIPMKAAALNLALVLVGNLQKQPWEDSLGAGATDGAGASSSSSSNPAEQQLSAVTAKVRARSPHFVRLAEEVHYVLFDSRRNHCHLLVLNYFTALGGMQVSGATPAAKESGCSGNWCLHLAVSTCSPHVTSQPGTHLLNTGNCGMFPGCTALICLLLPFPAAGTQQPLCRGHGPAHAGGVCQVRRSRGQGCSTRCCCRHGHERSRGE
jgi:hypothetical protein